MKESRNYTCCIAGESVAFYVFFPWAPDEQISCRADYKNDERVFREAGYNDDERIISTWAKGS
jgi:hypothetical protein